MEHLAWAGMIPAGAAVISADGQSVGTVFRVSGDDLVVKRGCLVYIPLEAVVRVSGGTVTLAACERPARQPPPSAPPG